MGHLREGYPTDHPATCDCQGRGWFADYMGEDFWWCEKKHAPSVEYCMTLRAANEARQKEWDQDNQITLAYRGNELAGEVGEACNIVKKLERERLGIRGSRATTEQLAEELADVIICADLIAMDAGIDLQAAVRAKFNATSAKNNLKTRLG